MVAFGITVLGIMAGLFILGAVPPTLLSLMRTGLLW